MKEPLYEIRLISNDTYQKLFTRAKDEHDAIEMIKHKIGDSYTILKIEKKGDGYYAKR
jgi:hypothetical protein